MIIDIPALKNAVTAMNISLTERQIAQFEQYACLLAEWNRRMNLTAVTDPAGISLTHFADSLSVAAKVPLKENASLIDVGTGAGFPGMALKILRPDLRVTLLDATNKRVAFLRAVIDALELNEIETVHARAEEAGQAPQYRERYDYATARAVAALPVLCEYCLPFVRTGGTFIAQKGPDPKEEISAARNAIEKLGGRIGGVYEFTLPDYKDEKNIPAPLVKGGMSARPTGGILYRSLISIQKISQTPRQYPRNAAKMSKNPI